MLPRPVAVLIAIALTLGELVNIVGQVFLNSGDTAIHVMYPAVLAALGVVAKKPEEGSPDTGTPGVTTTQDPAPPSSPPTSIDRARHRHRGAP